MRELQILVDSPGTRYDLAAPVATVGNFDGVHLGHRKILNAVAMRMRTHHGSAVVITFDPHPGQVLRKGAKVKTIMTEGQKHEIFKRLGINTVIKIPFTAQVCEQSAEQFVEDFLVDRLGIHELYVGSGFRFGKGRLGDVRLLQTMGIDLGFSAFAIEPVYIGGVLASSTLIRSLIAKGDVREARRFLGAPYCMRGTVVPGKHRGATLGFPTANLQPFNELLPAHGVYATRCLAQGRLFEGATFVGPRPTFGESQIMVETFVLDAHIKLYGNQLELRFVDRIRDVWTFGSTSDLSAQIRKDVAEARKILETEP